MWCLWIVISIACGCTATVENDALEQSLRKAGKNRKELKKVLDHYTGASDSLKYLAAEFLIVNMDIQFSVQNQRTPLIIEYLRRTEGMNDLQAKHYVDSIKIDSSIQNLHGKRTIKWDIREITAAVLIENIDHAFEAWRSAPWYDHVDFNTFCKYILPYKSGNGPLQLWRRNYHDAFVSLVDAAGQSGTMMDIADTLLSHNRTKFRYVTSVNAGGELGPTDLLETRIGQCFHWAHTVNYLLRDFAIPSVLIYSPQWANHPGGHAWNGIIDSSGNLTGYAIEWAVPYVFDPMNWPLKTAKLYMQPFAKNDSSFVSIAKGRDIADIPGDLRDPRMVDVTARFVPVVDLPATIKYSSPHKQDVVFLCVFAHEDLNAIGWTYLNGNNILFADVGKDVVYVPAFYEDGVYTPASDPLIVSYDGAVTSVIPDTSEFRTIRLYRKYPLRSSMFRYTEPFYGMKIQTSKDREFSLPIDKYDIKRYPSPVITDGPKQRDRWRWEEYRDSVVFNPPLKSQYVRFLAAPRKECIVGEIECFDAENRIIKGTAYGSKPGAENIHDGTYGECFHDPDSLGWVAIDFGKEISIAKISYLPSNDSNSIQVGERYELLYWDREWISLGEQVAPYKYLDYQVPFGGLYWLRNLDTGKEERVFTMSEDGEQVWW